MLPVGGQVFAHLCRQLPRGRQHQRVNGATAFLPAVHAMQYRQGETGGLAGAGLGTSHEIAAFQHHGDGLLLDGRGLGVALLRNRAQQLGREAQLFKVHSGVLRICRAIPEESPTGQGK